MKHNRDRPIDQGGIPPDLVEEIRVVGGEATLEGQRLAAAAADAGLRMRWLDFSSAEAQAALATQGPGAIQLPLVIVGGAYKLQRPSFSAVNACLAALRSGDCALPDGDAGCDGR